jgi:nucleotide-binding universal stress UspA family protein
VENILVTLDGSEESERALPMALNMSRRMKLPVLLLGVNEPGHEIDSSYINGKAFDLAANGIETRPSLRGLDAKEQLPDFIVRFAHENESVIHILSTHGRSSISRSMIGSTVRKILSMCTIPLLLVKEGDKPLPKAKATSTILLPLDGSPVAEKAIPPAERISSLMGADLLLYRPVDSSYPSSRDPKPSVPTQHIKKKPETLSTAISYLKHAAAKISNVKTSFEADAGESVEVICRRASKPDIAFVFMPVLGYSCLNGFAKGCIAERVLGKCATPIILFCQQ